MRFRAALLASATVLLLSGCGKATVLTYRIESDVSEPAKVKILMEAAQNVMIRRLAAAEVAGANVKVIPTGGATGQLTLAVGSSADAETARRILGEPFTFDIRIEKSANPDPQADPDLNWTHTALTGALLQWAQAIGDRSTGNVSVNLQFSKAGEKVLSDVFKAAKGKSVGIFVRDLLVSKLRVADTSTTDHVIISGIPSAKVAEIFADDLNVGLRLTFTPLP